MAVAVAKRSCPECGLKDSLQMSDYHVVQGHVVCIGCGYVDAASNFKYDEGGNDHSAQQAFTSSSSSSVQRLSSIMKYSDTKRSAELKTFAKGRLSDVASNYGLTKEMTREAEELFERALSEHPNLNRAFDEQRKVILAGCCVYVVSRRHSLSVAVSYVANYLGAPKSQFIHILRQLLNALDLRIDAIDMDLMASSYLGEMSHLDDDERTTMLATVRSLIDICKRTLIIEGINAQPFLLAASYIAWCCVAFPPRKVNFSVFCRTMGTQCSVASRQRLNELLALLVQLSKSVPWMVRTVVTKKNVFLHVDSILKYRRTLTMTRESNVNESSLLYDIAGMRRKRKIVADPLSSAGHETSTSAKRTPRDDAVDQQEDNLDVISDDEMTKYLRTPQEVDYIQKLLQRKKLRKD